MEQKGDEITGTIVPFKLALRGKVKGSELSVGYDEGQIHVDATLQLEAAGNSFKGTFRASNGNRGIWNGWRPDPEAAKGEPADFSGLWLTDLGLMELSRDGSKVKGRYALRGTSSIEGAVTGRHFEFRIKAFRGGPGWFDLDRSGASFAGAGGTDGMPGWYGWKGRRATEYVRHAPLVAGKIIEGSTKGLLTYSVRAPEGYVPTEGKKWPTIVILHGSNMNGNAYVNTLAAAWPDIARDCILLGINGELPSNVAPENTGFNYTYVNYVGKSTFGGFPGTDRESPALVRESLTELKDVYPVKHYFVGGHSQGGFLAYSLMMNSPELIAGAFPISAGVIFQCEPSAYADKPLMAAQRKVPLAIVHGRTDPMVSFEGGSYAYGLFLDAGWPAVRLFADDTAGHMFARLPVGAAIHWLQAMASDDPVALLDFAEHRWKEGGRRDAIAAVRRLKGLRLDGAAKDRLDRLVASIDAVSGPKARSFLEQIRTAKDGSWIDDFLAFRDEFAYADAAAEAMAAFDALRDQQDASARNLMNESRGQFQQGRRDDGRAKLKEIVERYYASSVYRLAKKGLEEPK
jgi:predicted esterase